MSKVTIPSLTLIELKKKYQSAIEDYIVDTSDYEEIAAKIMNGDFTKLQDINDLVEWASSMFLGDLNEYLELPRIYAVVSGEWTAVVSCDSILLLESRHMGVIE